MVNETKHRIGYASKRTTCHSTAPRCLADGNLRLKLVDSQAGGNNLWSWRRYWNLLCVSVSIVSTFVLLT